MNPSNRQPATSLIEVRGLHHTYRQHAILRRSSHTIQALDGVDIEISAGTTLALVGASGSGKSTLARYIAGLERPRHGRIQGEIRFKGELISHLRGATRKNFHRQVQLIFQDTALSLNPRLTAEEIIMEPLRVQHIGTREEQQTNVSELLLAVGLPASWITRRPGQMSGGERQRVSIARALALKPSFLVLDEALAGLDLSLQVQMIALLRRLQATYHLTYLYISHDLRRMAEVADEIAVISHGRIVERQPATSLLRAPQHPATRALIAAMPGSFPHAGSAGLS